MAKIQDWCKIFNITTVLQTDSHQVSHGLEELLDSHDQRQQVVIGQPHEY